MRGAAFVLGNLLALSISFACADLFFRDREVWRRALAAVAGYPIVILFVILSLGTLRQLSAWVAVGILAVVAGALYFVAGRTDVPATSAMGTPWAGQITDRAERFMSSMSLGLFGAFAGIFVVSAIFRGTSFRWDDLSYHAPAAAGWLIDGRFSLVPFNYHAYFPFNAETLSLWFMLPFRSDALASLASLYWVTLMVVAVVALSRSQGHAAWAGVLASALILASPVVTRVAHSFAPVDLAGTALVLAAVVFASPSSWPSTPRTELSDAAYAGLLSGFAVGSKVSLAPAAGILLLWYAFGKRQQWSASDRMKVVAAFVICAASSGSFWYIRNLIIAHSPIFPTQLGPFDGPFDTQSQYRTKLISWVLSAPADPEQWRYIIQSIVRWPVGLFLVAAVGYGAGLCSQLRRGQWNRDTRFAPRVLLLAIGITLFALFPLLPFSGTNNNPHAELKLTVRYLIPSFAIGIVLFSALMDRDHLRRWVWFLLALLAVVTAWNHSARASSVGVTAGLLILWLWQQCQGSLSWKRVGRAVRWVVIPAGLIALVLWMPVKQRLTDAVIHRYDDTPGPIREAWRALETLPDGSRISWFGSGAYQYYPTFGRRLQLIPSPVEDDGSPYRPLHRRWRTDQPSWWADAPPRDLSPLVTNLIANNINYVLVTKESLDRWPPQQHILATSGRAQPVYDDGYSTIWKMVNVP
jgi:hypothetical protein